MEDLTGKQLGPYQVVAPLGEGGMAAVYKAYQPSVDRYVALKVLPRYFASDPQFVGRFEQEAKVIAKFQHPHILPVFDFGEADGYTYIVMPFVEGGTLADFLKGQPLSPAQIERVISQVGDALAYAHARGVVHRDVKPSNILIDPGGNCLLTDFGVAKIVEGTAQFTRTGGIVGTPAYMAPEQIQGHELDGRSDLYSLGIVLYEMAAGRPPYRAETPPAIFVKHLHDPLPLPRTLNPALPEGIERVILKALAKNREARYPTAGDLVQAVRTAVGTATTTAERPEVPGQEVVETVVVDARPPATTPVPAPAADASRQPANLKWILAIVGLVILVGVIGWIAFGGRLAGISGGDQVALGATATPTAPSPAASAPVVPEAADTPAPIKTPVPAKTSTPRPTQTPLPTETPKPVPSPTSTATAAPTDTPLPTDTPVPQQPTAAPIAGPDAPLPGTETVPLSNMASSIPWLPLDESALPSTYYYGFNVAKPPFDNRLVRQAFAAAVDRQAIADLANSLGLNNARPATTFTPPETLGRDLYGQVGLPFDPGRARELLAQAGYPNGAGFPQVKLVFNYLEVHQAVADAVVSMWRDNLGVTVELESVDNWDVYIERLNTDAPAIFRLGWAADYNDPDNFLLTTFHSTSEHARGKNFANSEFDRLVEQAAAAAGDPAARQALYIQAERVLCEQEAAIIPLFHYHTAQ